MSNRFSWSQNKLKKKKKKTKKSINIWHTFSPHNDISKIYFPHSISTTGLHRPCACKRLIATPGKPHGFPLLSLRHTVFSLSVSCWVPHACPPVQILGSKYYKSCLFPSFPWLLPQITTNLKLWKFLFSQIWRWELGNKVLVELGSLQRIQGRLHSFPHPASAGCRHSLPCGLC